MLLRVGSSREGGVERGRSRISENEFIILLEDIEVIIRHYWRVLVKATSIPALPSSLCHPLMPHSASDRANRSKAAQEEAAAAAVAWRIMQKAAFEFQSAVCSKWPFFAGHRLRIREKGVAAVAAAVRNVNMVMGT